MFGVGHCLFQLWPLPCVFFPCRMGQLCDVVPLAVWWLPQKKNAADRNRVLSGTVRFDESNESFGGKLSLDDAQVQLTIRRFIGM